MSVATEPSLLPEPVTRRGITEYQWTTLANLFPGAKFESALMVWDYCKARGLDPMKKPCHVVPMRVRDPKTQEWGWRDIVMPGIYEYRITAHRTGLYRGHTKPEYGPELEYAGVLAPKWCDITAYRGPVGQTGDPYPVRVFFAEVVSTNKEGNANDRWGRAPIQMMTKCAEAAALREAFPEEFGGEHTAEELEGKRFGDDEDDERPSATTVPFQRKSETVAPQQPPSQPPVVDAAAVEAVPSPVEAPPPLEPEPAADSGPSPIGRVISIKDIGPDAVTVELDTGYKTGTRQPLLIKALRELLESKDRVKLITQASSNAGKYYPKLIEIVPA